MLFDTTPSRVGDKIVCVSFNPQGAELLFINKKLNEHFIRFIRNVGAYAIAMLETQIPSGEAKRFKHTSTYYTSLSKCATQGGYTMISSHHSNGRASHGVILLVKDNIKIDRVLRISTSTKEMTINGKVEHSTYT